MAPHAPETLSGVAEPTLLQEVVSEGLRVLQRQLAAHDRSLPAHVARELEDFLGCGDARRGFAWLTCGPCGHHRLVPFTCQGRGFCPRCGGRRMAERAAHWVDHLFPRVAVRQWVLTVPWPRRWDLARHPDWTRGVLRRLVRRVERHHRDRLRLPHGRTGSVTVVQRFGSALNLNVHLHVLMLDGLYAPDRRTGQLRFHRAPRLRTSDVEAIVVDVARRCERYLTERRVWEGLEDDPQETLPGLQAASIEGRSAVTGARAERVQQLGGRTFELPPRCAAFEGYNLHGNVCIGTRDRRGLERLCRYVLRPPLGQERLSREPDGRVRWTLRRPWSDGTTALLFTPAELVERLVALVPPPRANTVLYHGVLAANAKDRGRLLPRPRPHGRRRRAAPDEALRQWVFTLPQPLPRLLAWEPDLLRRVLAVVARSVQDSLRRRTRQPDGRAGLITFVQTFTGDLRLFVHFHVVAPEGVWVTGDDEVPRFVRAGKLLRHELEDVVRAVFARVVRTCTRWWKQRDEDTPGRTHLDELGRLGEVQEKGLVKESRPHARQRRWIESRGGVEVHAGVLISRGDARGREHLLRYAARPGVCLDRLAWTRDGRVEVRFKRPWKNGTVGVTLKPVVFVLRLAALLLPGGVNLVRYHGVFAPGASGRADIVGAGSTTGPARPTRRWIRWAELIARVFQRCAEACPRCGERMALLGMFQGDGRALNVLEWIERHSPPIRAGPPG
jgi:hypothetical protein